MSSIKLGQEWPPNTWIYAACDGPDLPGYWFFVTDKPENPDGSLHRREDDELSEIEANELGIYRGEK